MWKKCTRRMRNEVEGGAWCNSAAAKPWGRRWRRVYVGGGEEMKESEVMRRWEGEDVRGGGEESESERKERGGLRMRGRRGRRRVEN